MKARGRRASNKGPINSSQFNSISFPQKEDAGDELYCETTDKKGYNSRKVLSST